MNSAEKPPVAPKTPEQEKPKNRLREMLFDEETIETGATLRKRRVDAIPKNLPEEIRNKRIEKIDSYFDLLRQLRDRCEKEWEQRNKATLGGYDTLTPAQIEEKQKYTDRVETKELSDMLEQWIGEYETLLQNEKDEKERRDLELLIDAANELQADMANW